MDDRRQFQRRQVYIPVAIETADRKGRAGITRDVSAGGLLLQTASRFAVGELVDVRFSIGAAIDARATGRVVRTERDPDAHHVLRNIVAIAFAFPLPELQRALG